jgi:dinuclear metal center YbgI/SA1388 family protein
MARLPEIVRYLDRYLGIRGFPDSPNALNGLQVENSGRVTRIAAGVDGSTRTLEAAAKQGADFLILHHGLFWSGLRPITGAMHRQIRIALRNDIAVYGAHLPLDAHRIVGNNACLARAIGLKSLEPFLEYQGQCIGLEGTWAGSREELLRKTRRALGGEVKAFPFGPAKPKRIAVVTGAAGSDIHRVGDAGIDTFITGEAPHWAAIAAAELGMNLFLGGHYATETFGVKALAAHLSKKFSVPWAFLDFPTGL